MTLDFKIRWKTYLTTGFKAPRAYSTLSGADRGSLYSSRALRENI